MMMTNKGRKKESKIPVDTDKYIMAYWINGKYIFIQKG